MFLDGADDVEGDLTGTAFRVVGASLVVMNQEGIDEDAGVLWRHACMEEQSMSYYFVVVLFL